MSAEQVEKMLIQNGFASHYEVRPAPPEERGRYTPRKRVTIVPDAGAAWMLPLDTLGMAFSGMFATPSADHLLAVEGGEGVLVHTAAPGRALPSPASHLIGVARVPEREMLLVWGYYEMFALDVQGIVWHARTILYGDLEIQEITPDRVRYLWIEGNHQDGSEIPPHPFELDVRTGRRISGEGFQEEWTGHTPWP